MSKRHDAAFKEATEQGEVPILNLNGLSSSL